MSILEVENLSVLYPIFKGLFRRVSAYFKAVNEVSFTLNRGEVLSVIGESGSGKTTIGNTILGLIQNPQGRLLYNGADISHARFGGKIQAVFQNPYSSMNPRLNVLAIVSEPLRCQSPNLSPQEVTKRVLDTLQSVGLDESSISRYPHEFSGGQRQRISIARAIITEPQLIILDEPVSSLDVSIRAQILNLLKDLQLKRNLSYIYISHDLATVRFLSDRVLILYGGRTMEVGSVASIFNNPKNPYTQLLLKSARDILIEREVIEKGESHRITEGCPFVKRCPKADGLCHKTFPIAQKTEEDHVVFCHHL